MAQTGHESRTGTDVGGAAPAAQGPAPSPGHDADVSTVADDAYVVSLPAGAAPAWEGPLDLLLHLIQKHELDILDIPVGFVTKKYLEYIALMQSLTIDLASEYLVMAATLAHIKSKMLLPDLQGDASDDGTAEEEEDPRAELVRRLLEYQKYKRAAEQLVARDTLGGTVFERGGAEPEAEGPVPFASFGVFNLLDAFSKVLERTNVKMDHEVVFDRIGISERIIELTDLLRSRGGVPFEDIFLREGRTPSRFDVVITFLAVLEMCRLRMMRVYQTEALAPIHVDLVLLGEDDEEPSSSAPEAVPAFSEGLPQDPGTDTREEEQGDPSP